MDVKEPSASKRSWLIFLSIFSWITEKIKEKIRKPSQINPAKTLVRTARAVRAKKDLYLLIALAFTFSLFGWMLRGLSGKFSFSEMEKEFEAFLLIFSIFMGGAINLTVALLSGQSDWSRKKAIALACALSEFWRKIFKPLEQLDKNMNSVIKEPQIPIYKKENSVLKLPEIKDK